MRTIKNRLSVILLFSICWAQQVMAQNLYDDYNNFVEEVKKEYNAFRAKTYEQYLDFVKKAWGEFKGEPAMELPKEKTVVPVLSDNATEQTASWFNKLFKKKDDKTPKRKSKKRRIYQLWTVVAARTCTSTARAHILCG